MGGVQVGHQDECHSRIVGHMFEKLLEGFQSPGGGADSHNVKISGVLWRHNGFLFSAPFLGKDFLLDASLAGLSVASLFFPTILGHLSD